MKMHIAYYILQTNCDELSSET